MVPYVGNGSYCYANATAMLLATSGEDISASLIEVLSGVGLGASWVESNNLLFFGNLIAEPDIGINNALSVLGFHYIEEASPEATPAAFAHALSGIARSPAVLGPLDMGYLRYIPFHDDLVGSDHFILVHGLNEHEVFLHDPEGYPYASLPVEDLDLAWRAESIPYRRGYYRYWTSPVRVEQPTEEQLYERALQMFCSIYRRSEELATRENWVVGCEAILTGARKLRRNEPLSEEEKCHMTHFALRLGARRALDYSAFFGKRQESLSFLKLEQARLFGKSHTLAVTEDWPRVADTLELIADIEDKFRLNLLLASGVFGL